MDITLSNDEARVLGALMEKEVTTPDYYPMTLNALVNACNQKSCRDPVVSFDEGTVSLLVDSLRDEKGLASMVSAAVSRVPKYKQRLTETYHFPPGERAILCELLLRGPQTPGELKNRAERMSHFESLDDVLAALKELETRADGPWVVQLPRQPGRKEARYMHLLCGAPDVEVIGEESVTGEAAFSASAESPLERIKRLEEEVANMGRALSELSATFDAFRKQFEG
jgi:uncharacterized protein